jgi:IMP dehydrogenase/GMP reductase
MLGSLLSGTDESPGTVILDPATGEKRKIYRGMTSPQAVFEALYDDASEDVEAALETPAEGQEVQVAYQGALRDLIQRFRGHLQSAVSYGGESSLAAVRAKVLAEPEAFLIPLSAASRRESFER